MIVRVFLFAALRERAGAREVAVEAPAGITVGVLRGLIAAAHPVLAPLLPNAALAINESYATDEFVIQPGDAVALIPPVSGG